MRDGEGGEGAGKEFWEVGGGRGPEKGERPRERGTETQREGVRDREGAETQRGSGLGGNRYKRGTDPREVGFRD